MEGGFSSHHLFLLQGMQLNSILIQNLQRLATPTLPPTFSAVLLRCRHFPFRILYSAEPPFFLRVSVRLIATCLASYQFEEGLRNEADPNGLHQRAKIQAMLMYYSCRMEAVSFFFCVMDLKYSSQLPVDYERLTTNLTQAWREGNDGVADFMLQKVMGETFLPTARAVDIELEGNPP